MKPKPNPKQKTQSSKVNPKQAVLKPAKESPQKKQTDPALEKLKISRVKTICGIVVIGLIASLLFHYYEAHILGKDFYPYNTFLFNPADRFNDFNNIYNASIDLNPFIYSVSVYFPFTYIVMHLFNLLDLKNALLLFSVSFIIFFLKYLYSNMPAMKRSQKIISVLILASLSYPFLFIIDRGNLEVWVFMSIAMFIYFYLRGKDFLSIIFLAMAISLKLYPAILGILFIIDKKYRLILYTAIVSIIITIFSAALLEGGVVDSINGQLKCLAAFNAGYMSGGISGLQHNTSLFVPLKLLYYNILTKQAAYPINYEKIFNSWYFVFAMIIFAVVGFIILRYKQAFWSKITLLIMVFILLPQISYDYKLINLFIPLVLFINSEENSKYNKYYCIIFGLLLIPKDYLIIVKDLSISSIINPILILMMLILIAKEAIQSKKRLKLFASGE